MCYVQIRKYLCNLIEHMYNIFYSLINFLCVSIPFAYLLLLFLVFYYFFFFTISIKILMGLCLVETNSSNISINSNSRSSFFTSYIYLVLIEMFSQSIIQFEMLASTKPSISINFILNFKTKDCMMDWNIERF